MKHQRRLASLIFKQSTLKQQQGINLIELLITLALVSIFLGLVFPHWQILKERQQQRLELNRLQILLSDVRQQANLQQRSLTLCASDDGISCQTSAKTGGLLLKTEQGQFIRFYPGLKAPLMLLHPLTVRPLPQRSLGGSLLPCTGFQHMPPHAITFSSSGRIRRNPEPNASLIAACSSI